MAYTARAALQDMGPSPFAHHGFGARVSESAVTEGHHETHHQVLKPAPK